jgi:hypothetical protein
MDAKAYADATMAQMLRLARKQFGDAVKGFWFYEPDPCPGCGFPIDVLRHKGQDALSLNTFIYRPRGMLIGYFLCSMCAKQIFEAVERNPSIQTTPLHDVIERNLITAYQRYLASQDA